VYESIEEIKMYLNYIINYNTSGSKFNVSDSVNSEFITSIIELSDKLDNIDINIKTYIKYPIDHYNDTDTNYINKIKDISSTITKLIKDLTILKLKDIQELRDQTIVYGITANVNQNFDNNHLQPTIRNEHYKKETYYNSYGGYGYYY
jgi:hypothetical protein